MLDNILSMYGIQPDQSHAERFGDGLINYTWKITTKSGAYILQQVNQAVFKHPEYIDDNISRLKTYLSEQHPDYLFVTPLADQSGKSLVQTGEGYFRLFPFVQQSHALNVLSKPEEACEAARQFGRFSQLLKGFDVGQLHITLPQFHDLSLRFDQFLKVWEAASALRKQKAAPVIAFILDNEDIVQTYKDIVKTQEIPLRVIHHDTKINNVLFDTDNKGLCVIDLDTVMPGYFISDVGDMMRTYLSPANEEETDLDKITVRPDFFKAIYNGYMKEMGDTLTKPEQDYFIYSGKFMIYMQALRFLTDYLAEDVYYGARYAGHNLNRAANQMTLLQRYFEAEASFHEIVSSHAISDL